jgi:EmrB/QacA subfamily drug resistance transporter
VSSPGAAAGPGPGHRWRALALLVAGAFFMENLDGTIVVTATQRMARSFGVPPVDLNVTIVAYLLTLGVFIPVSGWIADRFGARTVFGGAIAVFTLASGLCALSTSLPELTAMRVLQGIGGAMMVPVGRLIVLRATAKTDLITAIAYLTWPALAAPIIAPALGGALTTYASWRWIFAVNLPLGVAALAAARHLVPNTRSPSPRQLDWAGFVLTGLSLGTFVGGVELITYASVPRAVIAGLLGTGAGLGAVTVRHLRRARHPLLDLRVFRIPTFRVTNLGGSFFRMAIGATPFLLPLMYQEAFGWSPLRAGLVVVPLFAGNMGIKPLTTPILRRFGFRAVLIASATATGVLLALCATFTAGTPLAVLIAVLLGTGIARSVGFTAYNTIVFADVEPEEMNNANTVTSTLQQLTLGLGVTVGALALYAGPPIDRLLAVPATGRAPFVAAFVLVAALPFLAVIESASLDRQAGAAVTGPSGGATSPAD